MLMHANLTKKWLILPAVLMAVGAVLSFIPLPAPSADNSVAVKGKITGVSKGEGKGDIVLTIEGDDANYYINHGMDNGLTIETLSEQLLNKTAIVYYVKHWSLLNMNGKTRHIGRIELDNKAIYAEWEFDN